jgi:hypothetical protein
MHDEGTSIEEMTGAVRLGLFAGDAALALDRTIRAKQVNDADRSILGHSLTLLENLRNPAAASSTFSGPNHLAVGEAGLDALTAIEAQAADADVEQFLEPLVEGLRKALDGEVDSQVAHLDKLLQVFVAIGDAEVERVSCLSQPRSHSIPLWSPPQPTSRF